MSVHTVLSHSGQARLGLLQTIHGSIETPVFMPVGTHGAVKAILAKDLAEMGSGIILGNAYHLYLRPGDEIVRDLGGIQKFSGWEGAILTDSGGYQIFSLGVLRKIQEEGVTFKSHIDGSKHFLTPERVVEIQENLGSDICMCLDECVSYPSSHEYTDASVGLTTRWARRCKDAKKTPSLLFGIAQGGMYPDLRLRSTQELIELDFDGYALGGFSVGEPKDIMWEMVDVQAPVLPWEKPRYLMGLGFPEDIVEGVRRGIDMFDCVIPTRHARNGSLFTKNGRINIKHARYVKDETPLDDTCGCYTCTNYSKAYLRHLFISRELNCYNLNTIHNLYFYAGLMENIRLALKQDRFDEFYREFTSQIKEEE
jgi:queuine tRNA-ribosyltransferase